MHQVVHSLSIWLWRDQKYHTMEVHEDDCEGCRINVIRYLISSGGGF